ncbi:Topoisomerase II isoform 3 [Artemisia annua]|uniref:DNA topoisomerase (ATP-hydrolyzing) n=1 Tax=Artemisia annua TaxID=35608 RepID=A0A2U1PFD9_ARTAN|nr:Topoisomerase II isoform 3 [Artemisia annua]
MAEDKVPPNPSPTSYHKVADLLNIPKLKDAESAGKSPFESCTLVLTEYSAKELARGLGPEYHVFPLKGKLPNVRGATPQQLLENTEIQKFMNSLGLQFGKIYENVKELRYGHLMIMANKADDGLRMIGLLINFLHYFWPSLLKLNGFMRVFLTPMVIASDKNDAVLLFYTMPDYIAWKEKSGDKAREYKIKKYYQGGASLHSNDERIQYIDFINKDFKQYVVADLQRSIPSVMDGLKPDQRKILFYALKKPIVEEIEVIRFNAYVFEHSPYHYREASLVGTIIGMAQKYVGSNNINLLQPNGLFGTRLKGGKDHVESGRCLFTQLSPITRYIFKDIFQEDDHKDMPAWFIPIIPMVLVNGSEGRGTECSSFVPKYNPRVIIANLKCLIEGKKVVPMLPWYKGFKGDVVKLKDTLYIKGIIEEGIIKEDTRTFTITEAPPGTCDYMEFLEAASEDGVIKAYKPRSYNTIDVDFEVTMTEDQIKSAEQEGGLLKKLNLTTELSIANLYLLDTKGILKKYDSPEHILEDFYYSCLEFYEERKQALIRKHKIALLLLENKEKFIGKVLDQEIILFPLKKKEQRCVELKDKKFQSLLSIEREVNEEEKQEPGGYDYLLSTPIDSFTYEKKKELNKEIEEKKKKICELYLIEFKSLWLKDLDALDSQLDDEKYPLAEKRAPAKRAPDAAGPQRVNKKSRMWVSDSDEEEPEDDNDATEDSDFEDEE